MVVGLVVMISPLMVQLTNWYPSLAVAVKVALAPFTYTPAPLTVPMVASLALAVTVYFSVRVKPYLLIAGVETTLSAS